MSNFVDHSLSTDQFMTLAGNVMKKGFFESSRVSAKRAYGDMVKGKRVPLMRVGMQDKSTLDCLVSLDCSEYRGQINFSQFRRQLALLLTNFSNWLGQGRPAPVLSAEDGKSHVFNLPAVAADGTRVNAMVLGWQMVAPGQVEFKLLYIDPEQLRRKPESATAGA